MLPFPVLISGWCIRMSFSEGEETRIVGGAGFAGPRFVGHILLGVCGTRFHQRNDFVDSRGCPGPIPARSIESLLIVGRFQIYRLKSQKGAGNFRWGRHLHGVRMN